MKKSFTLITCLLFGLFFNLWAQTLPTAVEWNKSLGGTSTEGANAIKQTRDGGYIMAGYSLSNDGDVSGNHGYFDYWIVKVDSVGIIEHQVSLGETNDDNARSIEQTTDGGYIVAGKAIVAGGHGAHDFWIVKLFADLTTDWQKSLGGSSSDDASSIQQTTDGGYIVAGSSSSNDGDVTSNKGSSDYWIVKLDASGNISWQKTFGGTGSDRASMVRQTTDGGYIVVGTSDSDDNDITASNGSTDYWVIKLDESGAKTWQKSLGGSMEEEATCIRQAFDGGYIVAGTSTSDDGDVSGNHKKDYSGTLYTTVDYWIVKLNSDGTIAHTASLGGSEEDHANSVAQATDGSYVVAGYSKSIDGDLDGNPGTNSIYEDAWIVKLNGTLGLIEWQKTYGGSLADNALSVEQTSDNGYVAAGASYSNNGDATGNHGSQDFWILKLHYDVITTSLANATTTVIKNITDNITNEVNNGIFKLIELSPTVGVNALAGSVTTTVTFDNTLPTAVDPFVQRFYDITPVLNASTAEATVTLYFTQGEFDAYNNFSLANPGLLLPLLPTNKIDNGNVRIKQFHGQFQSTSDPSVSITPTVVWDFPNGWWVVTFPVSGFSRFYLTTSNAVLPLTLLEFNGRLQQNVVNLQWTTTNEIDVKEFVIERENQSTIFSPIGETPAASTGGMHQYSFTDIKPLAGNNFYRLRMIDRDGNFDYSNVITIKKPDATFSLSIYPNPAHNTLKLKISSRGNRTITVQINDLSGKLVLNKVVTLANGENATSLDVSKLSSGNYFLKVTDADGNENVVKKFVKR